MRFLLPRRSSHLGMQSTRTPFLNSALANPLFRQPVNSKLRRNFPKVRSTHRKEASSPHTSRIFSPSTSIVPPCTKTATSFLPTPGSSSRMTSSSVFSLTSAGGGKAGSPNRSRNDTLPTPSLDSVPPHPVPGAQRSERGGERDLPPRAGTGRHQSGKDGGREDVPADDRQVRRRLGGLRLLDQVQHLVHPFRDSLSLYDAVPRDLIPAHPLDREDRVGAVSLVDVDHLAEHGDLRVDHVVGQDDGERLLPDEIHGPQDGVPQAEGHVLPHVEEVGHVG